MSVCFIDRFSAGLDDLSRRQQSSIPAVLAVLHRTGRFSVFEATENETIAKTMDRISSQKLVEIDNSLGFPWSKVKLTDRGREILDAANAAAGIPA